MISRSNYIAITVIMCVVLLMFQLIGASGNLLINSGENITVEDAVPEAKIQTEKVQYERLVRNLHAEAGDEANVGLVGEEEEDCLHVGRSWCNVQKKQFCYYQDLDEAAKDQSGAGFLIVSGSDLGPEDVQALADLSEQGRHVVISGLPELTALENRGLRGALGIAEIEEDEITVDGFKLFAGLVIGGETVYTDYEQEMPYARLDDSVTAYAVAQSEDAWIQDVENEDLPAIIWRYAPGPGKVYVVNGDYLTGQMGAGLLTGFAADSEEAYLYPVVNAQVSVVENYPVLSDENPEVMEEEYGQDSSIVFRDILWPSITAIYYDTDDVMTVTSAPRLDYGEKGELDEDLLEFYYRQVTKASGEMGLSGYQESDVPLEEKIREDLELYKQELPNYEIRTFQAGGLEREEYEELVGEGKLLSNVHTVLTDYNEQDEEDFFTYLNGEVLELPVYMDSQYMENEDDLEEERRLCYVGITRAKEKLYLLNAKKRTLFGRTDMNSPSRFVQEITPELLDSNEVNVDTSYRNDMYDEERNSELKVGDKVKHAKYGYGIVVQIEGSITSIAFNHNVGIIKIMKTHKSLEKIDCLDEF